MNLGIEDEHTEFKKSTSELKEGVASIAAMLNKHGSGTLYFGVTPKGDVCGQDVSESTLRQISQAIASSIEPKVIPEISSLVDEGKCYIKVSFAGKEAPYSCKGTYRIRIADEDVIMTASQIEELMTKRINAKHPWDSRGSRRSIEDVDEHTLRKYVERGQAKQRIPFEFTNCRDVLERLSLLSDDMLTNAAEVLFCDSDIIRLKMGILETHARTVILDLHQECGTVFDLVDKGVAYIANNTRRRFIIKATGPRDEIPEIPTLAVKEALMNAYAHQDWTRGGCVQIDIFHDAVEILSPGWFIEGQDPDDHLADKCKSSVSRNMLMTKTLYRSGDIESYGTGIPRMKRLCDEVGVGIEYRNMPDGTLLVFHRNDAFDGEPAGIRQKRPEKARKGQNGPDSVEEKAAASLADKQLDSNESRVFQYLVNVREASARSISDSFEMPNRTVRNALNRLIENGLVTSIGKGRNTVYRVVE